MPRSLRTCSTRLFYSASAVAFVAVWPAHAQTAATSQTPAISQTRGASQAQTASQTQIAAVQNNKSEIEEVVVTARKRAERLQSVPVAITAFTAKDLANHPVIALADVAKQTPDLSIRSGQTDPFGGAIAIRGQYADNTDLVAQPSVGVYIDDVYQAISILGPGTFNDVSQIEVLKGAQGTLYGRNSTGGAIKISTPIPNYDGIDGKLKFGYGNYNQNEEFGALNIPIIDGKIAMRGSFERFANDGYGYIINQPNLRVNDIESKTGNIAFRFNPIDKLQLILRGDASYSNSNNVANNIISLNPLAAGGSALALNYGVGSGIITPLDEGVLFGLIPNPTGAQQATAGGHLFSAYQGLSQQVFTSGSYNAYSGYPNPHASLQNSGTSLNATYDINDDLQVKSVTAYRQVDRLSYADLLGSSIPSITGLSSNVKYHEVTQELQLNGKLLDDKLKYTVGYYFYDLDGNYLGDTNSLPFINPANPTVNSSALVNDSNSFYGQGTYALTDKINFTTGLRWTSETSNETVVATAGNPALAYTSSGAQQYSCNVSSALHFQTLTGPLLPGQTCSAKYGTSFRNVSYTFGLDWTPLDNVLLYAKTSRGFKAGGINSGAPFNSFNPEISTDYEIGEKSDFFDHKLRINAAAFTTDYNNIQRPLLALIYGAIGEETINAASATVSGLELETTARPLQNLEIRASAVYLLAQYQKFLTPNTDPATAATTPTIDISSNRFSIVPRWHTSLSTAYTYPFEFGNLRTELDWTYTSAIYFSTDAPFTPYSNIKAEDGVSVWDARMALNIDKYDLEVALWGRNLFNKRYFQSVIDLSSEVGAESGSLAPPRTFGFEITKRF